MNIDDRYINEVYLDNMNNNKFRQIYFGGSASGKSVFLAQRCIVDLCGGGRNYLCVRNVQNTIKRSMFNELTKVIISWKLLSFFKINKSDLTITCRNGYQILFAGLDDVEKIKSITPIKGIITDIWIEEGTETQGNDVKQLERRLRGISKHPKRITMSFNPILKSHWIYQTYFKNWDDNKTVYNDESLSILKTTYKDNAFLTQQDIDLLENETDKYYREVYTLGNWGVLGNLIFKNWEMRDLTEEKLLFDNYKNGLDFGFSADPAALVRSHYDSKRSTIYITDELYEREMTNDILAKEVTKIIGREYIVCDSAEPKSIKELQRLGINALGAKKGKDSVNYGIDWLQRQTIIIDLKCQNFKNEIQQYKWKEDKDGNVLKVPVDKNNHLLDGTRYSYEDEMTGRKVIAMKAIM